MSFACQHRDQAVHISLQSTEGRHWRPGNATLGAVWYSQGCQAVLNRVPLGDCKQSPAALVELQAIQRGSVAQVVRAHA